MSRRPDKKSYAIIGLGRFGYALAMELAQSGAELLVIEKDEEKVRELREFTENAYVVKGYDKKVFEETGIRNCDVAVICIAEQIDVSILMTLTLVGMGIPRVIAKATSVEHGEILEKLGAEVVFPERDMAIRLAHRLESSNMLDYIQLSSKVNITKLIVPQTALGKSVRQIDLRGKFGLNIIAIERGDSVVEYVQPDYVFLQGDILYLAGSKDDLNRFSEWAEKS